MHNYELTDSAFFEDMSYGDSSEDEDLARVLHNIMWSLKSVWNNTMLDNIYPVGSIYMNYNNVNPSSLFGGTWERIEGRFLVSVGQAEGANFNAHDTGGKDSADISVSISGGLPSHTHSVNYEIPSSLNGWNFHWLYASGGNGKTPGEVAQALSEAAGAGSLGVQEMQLKLPSASSSSAFSFRSASTTTTSAGSGSGSGGSVSDTINTLPPYLAVYMWRRTR